MDKQSSPMENMQSMNRGMGMAYAMNKKKKDDQSNSVAPIGKTAAYEFGLNDELDKIAKDKNGRGVGTGAAIGGGVALASIAKDFHDLHQEAPGFYREIVGRTPGKRLAFIGKAALMSTAIGAAGGAFANKAINTVKGPKKQ